MTGWTESDMEVPLAVLAGLLTAAGIYLMLGRNLVRFLFGLMMLSNAANVAIFASGRLTLARPPVIPSDAMVPAGPVANALPQALLLTAIVIGFGLLSFVMVLAWRAYATLGTIDSEAMRLAEPRVAADDDGDDIAGTSPDGEAEDEDDPPARLPPALPAASAAGPPMPGPAPAPEPAR